MIRTINSLNLLIVFFIVVGYSTYFILDNAQGLIPATLFLVLHVFALFLSKIRRPRLSFIVFTITVNSAIFFINQFYPKGSGAFMYYFPLIVSVVLLNNPSFRDRYTVFHFALCIVFFVCSLALEVPGLRITTMDVEQVAGTFRYNLVISALTTAVLCFQLSLIISRQNREIMTQNENLTRAQLAVSNTLREKEILLAELHHRVKNNLAIISGLLNLQGDATSNDEAREIISESKNRILSMALVHRMLFENPSLKSIDVSRYSHELIAELFNTYNLQKNVTLEERYDDIVLPVGKSIPLGLILNEIVTNSIKYAFRGKSEKKKKFSISITREPGGRVKVEAQDNGKGFPEKYNFDAPSLSLGIFLIKTLSEQIEGTVRFSNNGGARIELEFPQQ